MSYSTRRTKETIRVVVEVDSVFHKEADLVTAVGQALPAVYDFFKKWGKPLPSGSVKVKQFQWELEKITLDKRSGERGQKGRAIQLGGKRGGSGGMAKPDADLDT